MGNESVLLVGKPWRGGLAHYVRTALEGLFPHRVEWIATYPETASDAREYRKDRVAWREAIVRRIEKANYAAALFINHPDGLNALPLRDNHILWLTDDPRQSDSVYAPYARVFVTDPGYGPALQRALGYRYGGVIPFAHCRRLHRSSAAASHARGACTIANRDEKRDAHIEALYRAGLPLLTVGNYFANHWLFWRAPWRFRPRVSNASMGAVYARHTVSLNVHANVVRGGTNMRTFECAGYAIAQLVESRPGLDALFAPDEEVATYDGLGDLPDALRALLSDPPRRARLAARALARVESEHCYEHRVAALLSGVLEVPELARWRMS